MTDKQRRRWENPVAIRFYPSRGFCVTNESGDILAVSKTNALAVKRARSLCCEPINCSWKNFNNPNNKRNP